LVESAIEKERSRTELSRDEVIAQCRNVAAERAAVWQVTARTLLRPERQVRPSHAMLVTRGVFLLHEFARLETSMDQAERSAADSRTPPAHFVDPLTDELMRDPVRLPASRQVIDRDTLLRHLLSSQTPNDPFCRVPLRLDEVEEVPQLRRQIRLWCLEHSDLPSDLQSDQSDSDHSE
ncbi:MAG: hypothetical protein MHM6MM_006726, partial [Cercozoa sp. M6MM]